MRSEFLTFEITDEQQKMSFTNMLDWERNYRRLICSDHRKQPKLHLSTGKRGPAVAIKACCHEFFRKIVDKKSLTFVKM